MPIHMTVKINQDVISHIHIARVDENLSMQPDALIEYSVVVKEQPTKGSYLEKYAEETPSWGDWLNGVKFQHRYGDGALVCVQKAVEAYTAFKNQVS